MANRELQECQRQLEAAKRPTKGEKISPQRVLELEQKIATLKQPGGKHHYIPPQRGSKYKVH